MSRDNWFAHYAQYAYEKGLIGDLAYMKNGKRYINSDEIITRYEAIWVMMTAYNQIHKKSISIS